MSEAGYKWYALKAISGKEHKVKEYIDAACQQTDLGMFVSQALVPMEKTVHVTRGKRVPRERLFLPGYVLVECKGIDKCYSRLRDVPNVIGFLNVSRGDKPDPIPQSQVNRLLGNIDEQEMPQVEEFPFLVGEMVKVTDGPFNGFNGVIYEILADKKKLKVEVTIFGRKTPLELSFNQVDKE